MVFRTVPLFDEPVDPDFKELVVFERSVRHDDAVVELVVGPTALGRPVVVAQLDHLALALVEAKLGRGQRRPVGVAALRGGR